MPVEQAAGANRQNVTHLEALGRLLAGHRAVARTAGGRHGRRTAPRANTRTSRAAPSRRAVDPASPDFLNFTRERQPLVDAAFLAQALLRAPRALRDALERDHDDAADRRARVDARDLAGLQQLAAVLGDGRSRAAQRSAPTGIGCASTTRCASTTSGTRGTAPTATARRSTGTTTTASSSTRCCSTCSTRAGDEMPAWKEIVARASTSARAATPPCSNGSSRRTAASRRSAARSPIAAARSTCSRQAALRRALPDGVSPAQVRGALTAVIRRTLEAPDTFDADGWLRIGFCGHQPGVGETYISTGSLYLCSVAFLPLGLRRERSVLVGAAAAVDVGQGVERDSRFRSIMRYKQARLSLASCDCELPSGSAEAGSW